MMCEVANGMLYKFGFVGCADSIGTGAGVICCNLGDCLGLFVGAMMGGTVPGLLFLVSRIWVRGFSCNKRGAVGFVVVVMSGALATL